MTYVKICGLSRPEDVAAAREAGAHFIGLVFAECSRRRVTVEQARRLAMLVPRPVEPPLVALPLPAGHTSALWFERCAAATESLIARRAPLLVGVFADQPASLVNSIADAVGLDFVQLSGHESWEDCLLIRRPVIKTERVAFGDLAVEILARVEVGTASLVLLDTAVAGRLGGTGQRFDWDVGRRVAEALPVLLAGGLTPENVGEAIRQVRPWGVDVSSGVETGEAKDPDKIRAFMAAVRAADAGATGGAR